MHVRGKSWKMRKFYDPLRLWWGERGARGRHAVSFACESDISGVHASLRLFGAGAFVSFVVLVAWLQFVRFFTRVERSTAVPRAYPAA